jgi:hypothetical protein
MNNKTSRDLWMQTVIAVLLEANFMEATWNGSDDINVTR